MADVVAVGEIELTGDASGFERAVAQVTASADKTGKAVSAGFKSEFGKVSSASAALAASVGGSFGKIGSVANSALRPIAEVSAALGPAGLAGAVGAGLVAAAGLGASAMLQLGEAVGEAGERLDKLGLLTLDQSLAAEALRAATDASAVATDALTYSLGSSVPAVEGVTHAWTGLKVVIAEAARGMTGLGDDVDSVDIAGFGSRLSGLPGILGSTASAVAGLAAGYSVLSEKGREFTQVVEEQGEVMALVYGPTPQQLDEVGKAHREMERLKAEAARKSAQERAEIDREFAADHKMWVDYDKNLALEQRRLEKQYNDERRAEIAAYHDDYLEILQAEGTALQEQTDLEKAEIETRREVWTGFASELMDSSVAIADSFVAGFERRVAAGEELTEEEKKQAATAYAIAQQLAFAQVMISAAITGAGVAANLAAAMGPFALVAGAAAAAGVLATGITAIATAPAPEFPMGLSQDHHLVGIQGGEGIASRRAMQDPDVREALELGNLGIRRQREEGTGVHVSMDPRMKRLRVTVDGKYGKRPRRGR